MGIFIFFSLVYVVLSIIIFFWLKAYGEFDPKSEENTIAGTIAVLWPIMMLIGTICTIYDNISERKRRI